MRAPVCALVVAVGLAAMDLAAMALAAPPAFAQSRPHRGGVLENRAGDL